MSTHCDCEGPHKCVFDNFAAQQTSQRCWAAKRKQHVAGHLQQPFSRQVAAVVPQSNSNERRPAVRTEVTSDKSGPHCKKTCRFAEGLRHIRRMLPLKATCNGDRIRSFSQTSATGRPQNSLDTGATPSRHPPPPHCRRPPEPYRSIRLHFPRNGPAVL